MAQAAEAVIATPPATGAATGAASGAQTPAGQPAVDAAPGYAPESASDAAPEKAASKSIVFRGSERNLVPGIGLLFASALAFSMGMTDVFFAEAVAWTFAIWGALLVYMGLLDVNETYEITDDMLIIANPARFWGTRKEWPWGNIRRMEIVVKRRDENTKDVMLQIYYTQEGEVAIEREDRVFDPALAQLIIERAGLRPADKSNPTDLTKLPTGKATYTWN